VALGDVHGDVSAFEESLVVAGVVAKPGGYWSAGESVVVQVGDTLDRGIGEVAITLRLHALEKQAAEAGGALIRLIGNHEVMNYSGDWRYVCGEWGDGWQPYDDELGPTLDAELGKSWRSCHPLLARVAPSRACRVAAHDTRVPLLHPILEPFRATSQVAVVVGDTVLVHAGLVKPHLSFVQQDISSRMASESCDWSALWSASLVEANNDPWRASLVALNTQSRRWVNRAGRMYGDDDDDRGDTLKRAAGSFVVGKAAEDACPTLLTHGQGPVWLRALSSPRGRELPGPGPGLAVGKAKPPNSKGARSDKRSAVPQQEEPDAQSAQGLLKECLQVLGVKRMVVGHTPQPCVNVAHAPSSSPPAPLPSALSSASPEMKEEDKKEFIPDPFHYEVKRVCGGAAKMTTTMMRPCR